MRAVPLLMLVACTGTIDGGTPTGDDEPPVDGAPPAPVDGSLQISFSTTTKGGQYAPLNCVVAWIELGGTFVRTLDRKAGVRARHLVDWFTRAGATDTDAVSGASRQNHATPVTLTWDLKDNGVEVADGMYTLRIEMTEDNATLATQNNQGSFTFQKGPNAQMQAGLTATGFTNVSIDFTPGS
jgi:hypothetical protein